MSGFIDPDPVPCAVCGEKILQGEFFLVMSKCVTEYVHLSTPIEGREGMPVERRPVHLTCIQNPSKIPVRVVAVGRKSG